MNDGNELSEGGSRTLRESDAEPDESVREGAASATAPGATP